MSVTRGGDARIESSGFSEGKSFAGSLMLISGNRMLTKDVPIEPGAEIDALDGPVLQARLALELLSRAAPGGPATLASAQAINVSDAKDSIKINTASAGGEFPAPWTLKGTVKPDGSGSVFELTFSCAGFKEPMKMSGTWVVRAIPLELPDTLSIQGWRVFSLGPYSKRDSSGTIYDYGAQEIRKKFRTLGEVRHDAAKQK